MSEAKGRVVLACGAVIAPAERPTNCHLRPDGAARLVVYDSDGGLTRPRTPDKLASCLFGCPCKRKAGRKHDRCFPSDEAAFAKAQAEGGRMGVEIPWRHIVLCHGRWEP